MKKHTGRVGFLRGFASTFDLSGGRLISIRDIKGGPSRDREALAGDWVMVGRDIRTVMDREPCGKD